MNFSALEMYKYNRYFYSISQAKYCKTINTKRDIFDEQTVTEVEVKDIVSLGFTNIAIKKEVLWVVGLLYRTYLD